MGLNFNGGGIFGEAGVSLTSEHAYRAGRIAAQVFSDGGKKCRAVIGKDTRRSSYTLEYALCAGLIASGADAYIMHVTTAPSVAYTAECDGFDFGVMISGGSGAWYENGIRFIGVPPKKLLEFENLFNNGGELPFAVGKDIGRAVDYVSGRNRYVGRLIGLSECSYKRLKVGLDLSCGSAWQIAGSVFSALGAKIFMLGNNPDGTNVNRDTGLEHTEKLTELVKREKLDIGFSFDCDGERCVAADENGEIIAEDLLSEICEKWRKLRRAEKFPQNDGLETAINVMEALVERKCPASRLVSGFLH